jgi:hypothetical protein
VISVASRSLPSTTVPMSQMSSSGQPCIPTPRVLPLSQPAHRQRSPAPTMRRARLGDYFAEVLLLDQGTDAAKARAELG